MLIFDRRRGVVVVVVGGGVVRSMLGILLRMKGFGMCHRGNYYRRRKVLSRIFRVSIPTCDAILATVRPPAA